MEYFIVFYLFVFEDNEFKWLSLIENNNPKYQTLKECEYNGNILALNIMTILNEQGIMYKDLMLELINDMGFFWFCLVVITTYIMWSIYK